MRGWGGVQKKPFRPHTLPPTLDSDQFGPKEISIYVLFLRCEIETSDFTAFFFILLGFCQSLLDDKEGVCLFSCLPAKPMLY